MAVTTKKYQIRPAKGSRRRVKRLGRGNSSGRGTYSGRGLKGQRARSGGKSRTKIRGFRPSLLKIPKIRGFHSQYDKKETVTLETLERIGKPGEVITPSFLKKAHVINHPQYGIKIVAKGEIKKALSFKDCFASKKALELIEKAGGKLLY